MVIMWKIIELILITISVVCVFGGCGYNKTDIVTEEVVEKTAEIVSEPQSYECEVLFTHSEIPDEIKNKMYGVTISDSSVMSFDDLSYLTLTYYGYDGKIHNGNMIVDKQIADEVLSIFLELYTEKFPIEKMRLPCEYGGIDELSMQDNNTSAYNDRPIEGSGALSYHQLGRAIDINPLVNPYIRFSDGEVLPTTAHKYLDRTIDAVGMINSDSVCVRIFKKYGWEWGGDWTSLKDYQHFEKGE